VRLFLRDVTTVPVNNHGNASVSSGSVLGKLDQSLAFAFDVSYAVGR